MAAGQRKVNRRTMPFLRSSAILPRPMKMMETSAIMADFETTWPGSPPRNPFLFLKLPHSHLVPAAARHHGTPSRQKLGRKTQNWNPGGSQSVQGEAGGSEKSARCEIRGEIQRALFFCPDGLPAIVDHCMSMTASQMPEVEARMSWMLCQFMDASNTARNVPPSLERLMCAHRRD
jgi:hypothetical protein